MTTRETFPKLPRRCNLHAPGAYDGAHGRCPGCGEEKRTARERDDAAELALATAITSAMSRAAAHFGVALYVGVDTGDHEQADARSLLHEMRDQRHTNAAGIDDYVTPGRWGAKATPQREAAAEAPKARHLLSVRELGQPCPYCGEGGNAECRYTEAEQDAMYDADMQAKRLAPKTPAEQVAALKVGDRIVGTGGERDHYVVAVIDGDDIRGRYEYGAPWTMHRDGLIANISGGIWRIEPAPEAAPVQAQPEREEYVVCYKGELWRIIERDPREPMCDIRGVNVRTGDTAWGGSHSVTTATPARIVAELRAGDKIIDGNCEYRIAQIVAGGATEDEVGFLSTRTLTDLVARPGVTISWQQEREP